jgi:hypothetical protein
MILLYLCNLRQGDCYLYIYTFFVVGLFFGERFFGWIGGYVRLGMDVCFIFFAVLFVRDGRGGGFIGSLVKCRRLWGW